VRVLPATVLAVVILMWNVHHALEKSAPRITGLPARYFADVSIATHFLVSGDYPVAHYRVRRSSTRPRGDDAFLRYEKALEQAAAAAGISSRRPFATVPAAFFGTERVFAERRDDSGRAWILGYAFRARGGVAPYLIFWLAPLLAAVMFCWIAQEAASAGRPLAGLAVILLVGLSAYATDLLTLGYSAAGFDLIAVLALVAYAFYASRGECSAPGLLLRTGVAGTILAVCAICRNGALLLIPFFALSAFHALRNRQGVRANRQVLGLWAAGEDGQRRELRMPQWATMLVLAIGLLAGPYLLVRSASARLVEKTASAYLVPAEPQEHGLWVSLWEGLGDFDRSRGHAWSDEAARMAAGNRALGTRGAERILRSQVLAGIREDPLWFVGILIKRTLATLSQWKLIPWAPVSGRSMRPSVWPNEGAIDAYYGLTANLDWFRVGPVTFEVPLPLLWLPVLAISAPVLLRRSPEWRDDALLLGVVLVATMALPVAVTTAGALETQAVAVPYFLAAGLVLDRAFRARRRNEAREA
jgi:hypothetical protein